jgi:hypothetical protein
VSQLVKFGLYDVSGLPLVEMNADGGEWLLYQPFTHAPAENGRRKMRLELFLSGELATIRQKTVALERALLTAKRQADDPMQTKFITFRWQSDGESEKIAVCYGGEVTLPGVNRAVGPALLTCALYAQVDMILHFCWENVDPLLGIVAQKQLVGSTLIVTPGGSVDGRITSLKFWDHSGTGFNRLWVGIRKNNYGFSTFQPWWPAKNAQLIAIPPGSVTLVADANSQSGMVVKFDHSVAGNTGIRLIVQLAAMFPLGNPKDFVGEYRLLMRYRVDGATSATNDQIQFQALYFGEPVTEIIADPLYRIIDLGVTKIPLFTTENVNAIGQWNFVLRTLFLSGNSANFLHIDGFVLMPTDHLIYHDGETVFGGPQSSVEFNVIPTDDLITLVENYGVFQHSTAVTSNWSTPFDGGIVVIAGGSRGDSSQFADTAGTVFVEMIWRDRWNSFSS